METPGGWPLSTFEKPLTHDPFEKPLTHSDTPQGGVCQKPLFPQKNFKAKESKFKAFSRQNRGKSLKINFRRVRPGDPGPGDVGQDFD